MHIIIKIKAMTLRRREKSSGTLPKGCLQHLSDDHFRNHGFLLTPKGWALSPAYDMNPTLNEYQSLLINESSNKADINILLDSSESYMIKREKAEIIIQEVQAAVSQWESLATLLQIPAREMAMFKERFKLNL